MNKERINLGDIRINKDTRKPEICTEVVYETDGITVTWGDYDTELFKMRIGMSSDTHEIHPLQHFIDILDINQPPKEEEKDTIKIRYVYISSPTTMRIDPAYYETIRFKVLTLAQLEIRSLKTTLEELITDDECACIKILGRDRCTELKDIEGEEIYENDIIRWYPKNPKNHIDYTVEYEGNQFTLGNWYECEYPDTTQYCKVIGTIYDNEDI